MEERTKRTPKLRKIDIRVPVLQARDAWNDVPLLNTVDRAVMGALDGVATVHAITLVSGQSEEDVVRSFEKLERFGVILFAPPSRRSVSAPPQRLRSGMRPALKTLPADVVDEILSAARAKGYETFEKATPTLVTEGIDADESTGSHEVDELLLDDRDPEVRGTLTGIGPRAATG
jgi:hypothetical protein